MMLGHENADVETIHDLPISQPVACTAFSHDGVKTHRFCHELVSEDQRSWTRVARNGTI